MIKQRVDPASVARQFARALDQDDFAFAASLLASNCEYEARAGKAIGAVAVIRSYSDASVWARRNLDAVEYESQVHDGVDSEASIVFIDHITHLGKCHTYQCRQVLVVGASGRIERIRHVELPGQREALAAFLSSVGLTRP